MIFRDLEFPARTSLTVIICFARFCAPHQRIGVLTERVGDRWDQFAFLSS
jgi:hypothetical protein